MKYDAIIIGGGLGGLTAGAKLAREGRKVLLIEQHSKPGGCATTFRRGDFIMEVGLHEMDGPSPHEMKYKIFNELEVTGNVEFIKVPEFYHFISDHYKITVPHDPAEAGKILRIEFPEETEGIKAFYNQVLNPRKKASDDVAERGKSLGEFLDSIISNDDLKLILLGNLGYFHDDPYSISLIYYSAAQSRYFNNGGSFLKGGSQKLSNHLAQYIQEHGGSVLLNHIVTEIIIDNNKPAGVKFKGARGTSVAKTEAFADEIIANTAIPNLAELLPGEYGKRLKTETENQKTGASLLTIYFGFKSNLRSIGNLHYSTFVFDSSVKRQADIIKNNEGGFHRRNFMFTDYGQIDSGLAADGKSVGALCCFDYLKNWENLNRVEYNAKKEETAKIFIERLEKIFPGITNEIEYYEVATSATVKRYTLNPGGSVYGFAQVPDKPVLNISGIFDNLHIASSWGKTGGGFSGAIFSGFLCAVNILRKKRSE